MAQPVGRFRYPKATYETEPFPHAIIVGGWLDGTLDQCKAELRTFTDWDGEKNFDGAKLKRFCNTLSKLPPTVAAVIQEAHDSPFLTWLERLTGEDGLMPDPHLHGGGVHQISSGGYLKIHADFNYHERLRLYRRLNLLLYLNRDWNPEWGGALQLCGEKRSKIVRPEANVMVVFTTDDKSFHGHPEPMACPAEVTRDSIALYYYSAIEPVCNYAGKRLNTDYRG